MMLQNYYQGPLQGLPQFFVLSASFCLSGGLVENKFFQEMQVFHNHFDKDDNLYVNSFVYNIIKIIIIIIILLNKLIK